MTVDCIPLAVALTGLLACAMAVGCRPAPPLAIVVSGDTAGWIVPCGCTSNQSGGLPRRAAYVQALRDRVETILAEAGGAVHGTSPYDRAKFEAILRGESLMGVVAHNIGAGEVRLGEDVLRQSAAKFRVPLLSANVRDRFGRLVGQPVRIESVAGRRVALVGVLSERYATAELQVAPPRQAVLDALRSMAGRCDATIVLAYLPEDELYALAESLPEVDAVVGGPTGQPIAPKRGGPTLLASATGKGKFLVRLDAPALGSTERWSGRVVELDGRFADDPRQTANVERFRTELARWDFTPDQTGFAPSLPVGLPKGFFVAGGVACQKCHVDDCELWRKSQHAAAWKSLEAKGTHVDPECQRCHTTGYGLPGGFASMRRSPAMVDVGCESCHGPSQGHVADPATHTAHFGQARDHCAGCHDRENSPTFSYDAYWRRIQHGRNVTGDKP
ncbi:MAG: multiheme c-type cytochrome [Thermoguttaceae bacterium]